MSISEPDAHDAQLQAIEEIDASGRVMGKQVEVVIDDGTSDWPTFAEKARRLFPEDEPRWCSMEVWALQLFNGLSLSSILLLIALGLSLSFGLMNVINLARREFIMIGAYTT